MSDHIRHKAHEHHQAHEKLKNSLRKHRSKSEKQPIIAVFIAVFVITFTSLFFFRSWQKSVDLESIDKTTISNQVIDPKENIESQGHFKAVVSHYRIDNQAERIEKARIQSIFTQGAMLAAISNQALGMEEEISLSENSLLNSIWLTNYLSTGRQLTALQNQKAQAIQKSLVSTYYLGEKTININSTIQSDTRLLSQITNILSVDLFQYLNQSVNRADALDDYLDLLTTTERKATERSNELNNQVNFLRGNSTNQESALNVSEESFFRQLQNFNGPDAEEELTKFIGLQENQAEIKAKLGAYQSLKGYYDFFIPQISALKREIELNRDALIAGVKVTEVQNRRLPLIIQDR